MNLNLMTFSNGQLSQALDSQLNHLALNHLKKTEQQSISNNRINKLRTFLKDTLLRKAEEDSQLKTKRNLLLERNLLFLNNLLFMVVETLRKLNKRSLIFKTPFLLSKWTKKCLKMNSEDWEHTPRTNNRSTRRCR
mmetsp:Transcript_6095/g.4613  ORF Transcript_6095/g.4613 Transcript_6095/m.4613 type:complete len:136 (-) Transcript_6095:113-520(-)